MAYYLVRAKPHDDRLVELRARLENGEIGQMRPFGQALLYSLTNARKAADGSAVWEEEDYCRPPLAMERDAVLDTYFSDLSVELVEEGSGWEKIADLPGLWGDNGSFPS
jgi:hypothetical protein